jgi:integrase
MRQFPALSANYWDTNTKGLAVRVSPKGLKTFFVLIGSGRRQTLGHYPELKLTDARAAARKVLAEKTLGSVRPTHTAFADVLQDFLDDTAETARPRTVAAYKRYFERHFPFGRKSVASITNRDIVAGLKGLPPSQKHHAYAAARAFFNFATKSGVLEKNPIEKVKVPKAGVPRERVLSDKELAKVLKHALAGHTPFHGIVALLVLTGQRRGEIAAVERSWKHEDTLTFPPAATKNGREHTLPLPPLAIEVLDRQPTLNGYYFPAARDRWAKKPATVFNGWGKPKAAFDKSCGVYNWTLHDLRRTYASGLASLGVSIPVIERLLNHISGTFAGIVGVYQRYDYLPETRAATAKWQAQLQTLLKL